MPYIGRSTDGFGVRNRFIYLATSGATSVSGADANGATLTFTDGAYVDVYLNGVLLKPTTDYNTSTAGTIAGLSALNTSDEVTVIVYDVFTVGDMVSATSGGTFVGNVTHSGTVTFGSTVSGLDVNGTEIILDADADTSITADTDDQIDIKIAGQDDFQFTANTFTAASGSTIAAQALTATTVTASDDLTIDTDTLKVDASEDTVCINTTATNFDAGADDLIVGSGTGDSGITIYTGANVGDKGSIFFADSTVGSSAEKKGQISYEQNNEIMTFFTNDTLAMQIDLNGHVTKPSQVYVRATGNSTRHNQTSANTEQSLDFTENADNTNSFAISGGIFTAPVAGRYFVHYYASMKSNTSYIQLYVKHNSSIVGQDYNELPNNSNDWSAHQVTVILNLSASDTVQPFMVSGGTNAYALENYYRGCSIYLLG